MTAQPLLFTDLPTTDRVRKPPRRPRSGSIAAPVAVDQVHEPLRPTAALPVFPASAPPTAVPPTTVPRVNASFDLVPPGPPPPFDPATLSNAEARALIHALPDHKLSHLLLEAARELKRRALPDNDPDDPDTDASPNPALLRAARQVAAELSGEDV
ncbi:hypothetical protein [Azospirillum griseum]|uniref:Uncharacterized protein n=1 Tax=Azospirillum griseum TaxID=2496639 RepID=A0A3S0R8H6_9PROT|nr:hypothetical protein [Azospirillum griseum]RTR19467.1 hypothetical protein EJ903_13300 [Azospirillum griseum]